MPSDYHLVVAAQIRGSAERAGALSQRRASQLVAMFYLPYDADSVREVEEALAACGLAPTRPLSPDKPKEQVVVTIVGDSSFDDDIVGCMLDDTVIVLRDGQISSPLGGGPVAGAHATVDTAGQLTSRITATRWLLTGPLALAWQKKIDTRELYLMIEGQDQRRGLSATGAGFPRAGRRHTRPDPQTGRAARQRIADRRGVYGQESRASRTPVTTLVPSADTTRKHRAYRPLAPDPSLPERGS
jgi:hypothetical protein